MAAGFLGRHFIISSQIFLFMIDHSVYNAAAVGFYGGFLGDEVRERSFKLLSGFGSYLERFKGGVGRFR